MKVLYIGNYRDGTGWGNACLNNILAMDSVGIDVVPRAISFEESTQDYPDKIKQLESQSNKDCDVCIQHTLPHLYSYNADYKNIAFLDTESSHFKDTGWQDYINIMDELWVPCEQNKQSAKASGVKKPIRVVPHSLNISTYNTIPQGNLVQELYNTFNFIFVGEFVERKNVQALVRAFHMEFEPYEPVNLVIKTSGASLDMVQGFCQHVRKGLKLRQTYKEEVVICGKLQHEDYLSVFNQCHSFVMPSRGEAFCIPALEAMAIGIPVIYTKNTGMDDFCSGEAVWSIDTPCFGSVQSLPTLDTARSDWQEISIRELCAAMRSAYSKWNSEQAKQESLAAQKAAQDYDHKIIGQKIKELLRDC